MIPALDSTREKPVGSHQPLTRSTEGSKLLNLKMFRYSSVVLTLVLVAGAASAHQPPTNLHRVGDHWTAWDPPSVFPEGAEIHTVVKGDTLWDLAEQFYGNPYLWPQIWEKNSYVLDAHWIYPGDPLVVGISVTPIEDIRAAADDTSGAEGEESAGLRLDPGVRPPVPLGSEDDIYCSGFIGNLEESFPRRIIGSEYQSLTPTLVSARQSGSELGEIDSVKIDLSVGDVIYVDGGQAAGLFPGDLYTIVTPQEKVLHPESNRLMGRFYSYVGRVRVLSVQEDTAIAEIVHSCMPARVGASLRPFEEVPVPLARRTPLVGINDPVSAQELADAPMIVRSESLVVSLGQDHVVYIDRGMQDDVTPGDVFTIYRLNKGGMPPVVMGELGLLSVHENSSVAKILESRYTIRIGDRLDLKRR